jgi:hypothetical protein
MMRELMPEMPQAEIDIRNAHKAYLRECCTKWWADVWTKRNEDWRELCAEELLSICINCCKTGECADPLACPRHPPYPYVDDHDLGAEPVRPWPATLPVDA